MPVALRLRRSGRDVTPPSGSPATCSSPTSSARSRATATAGCSTSSCPTCCGSSTSSRSTLRRRRHRLDLRSGQPEARARGVRREVGARAARLRGARVAGGRDGRGPLRRGRGPRARARRERRDPRLVARPTRRRARRCGCCWPTTAPSTTRSPQLTRFAAAKIARRASCRRSGSRCSPPATATSGTRASRRLQRACSTHDIVPALRDGLRRDRRARGDGRVPRRRWRCCTRSAASRARSARCSCSPASFFMPRYDAQERGFSRYARITRFVRETLRDGQYAIPVPVTITVGRAEENAHNNREMARALAAQGYEVSLEEVPDMHNYVGWRDAFDPHLTTLLQTRLDAMNAEHHELYSPAIGTAGTVAVFGHYGRPVLAFPSEGGKAYDWRDNGMIGAVERLIDGGPGQALLRRLLRRGVVVEPVGPARGARARARPLRVVDPRRRSCRSSSTTPAARSSPPGSSLGAFHAANFALKRADLFPLAICMSGNYDPSTWNALGRARRADLLQQPDRLRRAPRRRPPRLAALAAEPPARLRPGPVGGHDRLAAVLQAARRDARREGNPPRARPVGLRRPARLALLARADRPPSPEVLLMSDASHLIGLLLGTEEDWPRAFETLLGARRAGEATRARRTT